MEELHYILVPKDKAQAIREFVGKLKGVAMKRVDDNTIGVPVKTQRLEEFRDKVSAQFGIDRPEIAPIRPPDVKQPSVSIPDKIKAICSQFCDLPDEIPTHWEIHGDLALFPGTCFKSERWSGIFPQICSELKVKKLAKKSVISNDDFRSPKVDFLYGDFCDSWTQRTENGIVYSWDITRSMFCVGNITEKIRVASFDCKDRIVVDLFAGIGYFTLPYLIHAKAKHVHACEWNPAAVEALKRNMDLNKVDPASYTIYEGDNRLNCPKNVADFVNLGLIPSSEISYKVAVDALRQDLGGLLLIHGNVRTQEDQPEPDLPPNVQLQVPISNPSWKNWCFETCRVIYDLLDRSKDWQLTIQHLERVKQFAPHVDHMVLDLKCTPV